MEAAVAVAAEVAVAAAGAARSGGGFSPRRGASRPCRRQRECSAERRRWPKGCRPACRSAAGAQAGARPSRRRRQRQGAAAGQRPAAAGGERRIVAAGSRPTSGQLNNFLDVPGPATGAVGAAGAAGAAAGRGGGAAADFLQGGGATSRRGSCRRCRRRRGRRPRAGRRWSARNCRARICPRIAPSELKTAASGKATVTSGATKFAISMSRTTPAISGRKILVGLLGLLPAPSRGRLGVRWEVGAAIAANQRPTATAKTSITRTTRSTPATSQSPRPRNMPSRPPRSPVAPRAKRPTKSDWLPLGVFALTQDGQASGAEPSLYMQLAISKQGVISGTLKNTLTGKVQSLEGMADKKSQRVAWGVVDQERPIMETGLSNLTQDTSPALIHFADGQTQQWLMVRIPEPKA